MAACYHRAARTLAAAEERRADSTPISGVPVVKAQRLSGLMDVALHPKFAENHILYLTYNKGREDGMMATVLARGRLEGNSLKDVKDIFVAEPWWDGAGGSASRIVFGRDGMLYMTTGSGGGANFAQGQEKNIHKGKVLRLKDDGTVPPDNPFVKQPEFKPEIYSWGHRNSLALIVHPVTGELWNSENGPNGGDEINIVKAGKNYGWPTVSMGRSYEGPWQGKFEKDGMEGPLVYWMPAIAASGLMIYTATSFRSGATTPSSAPCVTVRSRTPATCSASCSTRRPRRSAERCCSRSSVSAFATSSRGRMDLSTC
jgi:glucose/arabinose dehydrogenase